MRIGKFGLTLVGRAGFELKYTPGKHTGRPILKKLLRPPYFLISNPQHRLRRFPNRRPDFAVIDFNGGVAVIVAFDLPFETKVVEGRWLNDEPSGLNRIACLRNTT